MVPGKKCARPNNGENLEIPQWIGGLVPPVSREVLYIRRYEIMCTIRASNACKGIPFTRLRRKNGAFYSHWDWACNAVRPKATLLFRHIPFNLNRCPMCASTRLNALEVGLHFKFGRGCMEQS